MKDLQMRFSTFIFCLFVIFSAWAFFTIFFYFNDFREQSKLKNYLKRSAKKIKSKEPQIKDTINNNFWFVQITDLHISKFSDNGRSNDLLKFCNEHIKIIKPSIVLVSGDIADSKTRSALNSRQHKEEWKAYKTIIKNSNVLNFTKWLDVRGNHDSFNVPNVYHADNLFRFYSVQGSYSHQSYRYTHKTSFGSYNFIGIDTCPDPGLKRPYNFFGILYSNTAQILQYYNRQLKSSNLTFWFGHYPTSTIISPFLDLRSLIGESGVAYMCGHLHTLLNAVPRMYALQSEGYLELELADWRDSRYFRIGIVDHDIFSFGDFQINNWPFVIISNPKDASLVLPSKEAAFRIIYSTAIRIFVWHYIPKFDVYVYINDNFIGMAKRAVNNHPLHTLQWNPIKYLNRSNTIRVEVFEQGYLKQSISQKFLVDGTPEWNFKKWPSIILMGSTYSYLRIFYYLLWYSLFIFLASFRFLSWRKTQLFSYQDNQWIVAALRFAANDRLFYPLFIYLLYSVSCPLLLTELVDGHWGLVFVYGVYINGNYVPEASPYLSELSQNGTFILPLIFILIRNIRYDDIYIEKLYSYFIRQWFYLFLLSWQFCLIVYWTLIPYGIITTSLSPCRLHVISLSVYLMVSVRHTKKLPAHFYGNKQLSSTFDDRYDVELDDENNITSKCSRTSDNATIGLINNDADSYLWNEKINRKINDTDNNNMGAGEYNDDTDKNVKFMKSKFLHRDVSYAYLCDKEVDTE